MLNQVNNIRLQNGFRPLTQIWCKICRQQTLISTGTVLTESAEYVMDNMLHLNVLQNSLVNGVVHYNTPRIYVTISKD